MPPLPENGKKLGAPDCDAWDAGAAGGGCGADADCGAGAACGIGAGGTGILSVAAGDEATPVFGNGAGVGSGTFSAKTPAGLKMASPPINATMTIAGPSFAKPRSAINPSPAATPPVMHPRTQCSTRP